MLAAKIFISHSTKAPVARRYLDAVSEALGEDPRFEVLLDQNRLQGGDDWRGRIYGWMGKAHGAVLLLSEEALGSTFVPIELAILSFRRCREEKFPLIPVLVGDVQPEDTQHGVIGDIDLNRIQYVRKPDPADAAREVVASLRRFFNNRVPRTAREVLEEQTASHLRDAGFTEADLAWVVEGLPKWLAVQVDSGGDGGFSTFVHDLFRVDFDTACEALCKLAERRPKGIDSLLEVLDLVAPFWVTEKEAIGIAERALYREKAKRLLALDVEYLWTVRSFICRACLWSLSTNWICEVEPPDEEAEHGLASLRRQFLEHLDQAQASLRPTKRRQRLLPRRALQRALDKIEQRGKPLFVVLTRDWSVDEELLGGFREDFATPAIVVMGTGEKLALPKDECHILSRLEHDREDNAFADYNAAVLDFGMTSGDS